MIVVSILSMFKAGLIFCIIVVLGLIVTSSADDDHNELHLIRRSGVDAHSDDEYMSLAERSAVRPPKKTKFFPGSFSLLSKREKERLLSAGMKFTNFNVFHICR